MPQITQKRTGELVRALFTILEEHTDGLRARDALKALASKAPPTEFEKGTFPSGGPRYEKIVRWATVDCVKAGWMIKEDGRWYVTPAGSQALKDFPSPEAFYRRASQLYSKWKHAQDSAEPPEPTEEDLAGTHPNEKAATITLEMAKDQSREQIEGHLHSMDPFDFQKLVGALLTAMDYHVAWISPPGKDDGIDLLAYPDPLGTRSPRIKVQVKRYEKPISVGDVSAFMGNLGSEEVGIFVSTGGFTKDAESKARTDKQHRVTLIALDDLVRLWVKHYAELDETAKQRFPLQPIYFLSPAD